MLIIKFSTKEEYQDWLKAQSSSVIQKSEKFHNRFGNDVVPIVIQLCSDTCMACWGCDAVTHVFIHPKAQEMLENIIMEAEE